MPASIGVNLRVTGHCSQGGRKYMEDLFSVAYQQTEDERDLEYAFFGIYDGHGGSEAAAFAKEHLMDSIVKQRQFWSDNDEDVLKAIRNGYMLTHLNMWKELEKWPKTVSGLPSTAGTTASVAFIRRGKIYVGHVGDSAIVLGYQKEGSEEWAAKPLTLDHKPESTVEMERIQTCGGKVISKAGVPRVVWNRPRPGHKGPIKKNTPMDEIPFLAVARSLGDLWSYNSINDEFIVSPDPDVGVLTIDPSKFRCLIFGTDGLWNMISPEGAVSLVQATEKHNEAALVGGSTNQPRDWLNPSKSLVDHALERWSNTRMRADNTSVVTLMLDPPGPPRATVLRSRTTAPRAAPAPAPAPASAPTPPAPEPRADLPQNGLTIMTRYSEADRTTGEPAPLPPVASLDARLSVLPDPPAESDSILNYGNPAESYFMARLLSRSGVVNTLSEVYDEIASAAPSEPSPAPTTEMPSAPAEEPPAPEDPAADDGRIQINEVSSSSPSEAPRRGRRPPQPPPATRVLRSHDADHKPRAAPLERVVILSRRAPPALPPDDEGRRATRSQQQQAPQPGNCARAPGPERARRAPAARGDCAKENLGGARRRGRRCGTELPAAGPPPAPRHRPRADEPHSTTEEPHARALRSRNEAEPGAKRGRPGDAAGPGGKAARAELPGPGSKAARGEVAGPGSKAARLCKRATGPWAPALALRSRLRRRLTK